MERAFVHMLHRQTVHCYSTPPKHLTYVLGKKYYRIAASRPKGRVPRTLLYAAAFRKYGERKVQVLRNIASAQKEPYRHYTVATTLARG